MKSIFIAAYFSLFFKVYLNELLLPCSSEFCETYLEDNKCTKIPDACKIQNSTHNGVELPFPGPCNCCKYCLENLAEQDTCAQGDPTSPTPDTICGDGLICQADNNKNPTCQKMTDTLCTRAQAEYDKKRASGTLGHLEERPVCDRSGLFVPYKCVPGQNCYCVSEDGERIFGDIPFTANPEYHLRCKCPRNYHLAKDIRNRNLHRDEHLRCQSNGDYDSLQCLDDQCLCVDTLDGHPTYPEKPLVNMSLISESSFPCFDNKTHMEAEYYRECEALYIEKIKFIKEFQEKDQEVVDTILPNCQLDGYYAPVQQHDDKKYCSDPQGRKLKGYEVLVTDLLALSMDCKCARALSIIKGNEKPECCKNGNYNQVQCRRGLCYCVDENGLQIEKEVKYEEKVKLSCYDKQCM